MLLIYCVLLAVIVGWCRGGRLKNLVRAPLRGLWLPIAAFLLEAAISPLAGATGSTSWLGFLVSGEYMLLAIFLSLNHTLPPFWMLTAGTGANCLVIAANNWRMPVSARILDMPAFAGFVRRIQSGELAEYVIAGEDARLLWLGDVLHLPWVPGMSFASVGDILLGLGVLWLVLRLMGRRKAAPPSAATV